MASYKEWNRALINRFTNGLPQGTKVYLSVDEDLLESMALEFGLAEPDHGTNDFLAEVRAKVARDGRVNLAPLQGRCPDSGLPRGLAFLGATVLAACRMAEEEKIDQSNYFCRLKEVLGLQSAPGRRPPGMAEGSEERLWKEWNRWLMEGGFRHSARAGSGRADKYIAYPISQSLLRGADKDKLLQLFDEKQWKAQWDATTLLTHIRQEGPKLSQHLGELLGDRQRYEAVAEAFHEIYEHWLNTEDSSPIATRRKDRTRSRYLFAGLYRSEEPFLGEVEYYLYPKQQRGRRLESIEVNYRGNIQTLNQDRSGWYLPLGVPLTVDELGNGIEVTVASPSDIDRLILPERDFWIFTPDPENPDSGAYASWGNPDLGTPFIVLCKEKILKDLKLLRDERLLEWQGEPQPVDEGSTWREIDGCMVTSIAWQGVFIDCQELKDALQPTVKLSISLSGGLRVPGQNSWLEGYNPQVTVFGFFPTAKVEVINLLEKDEPVVFERSQSTNKPFPLDELSPGIYLLRAKFASEIAERLLKIADWNSLQIAPIKRQESMAVDNEHFICGSIIEAVSQTNLSKDR